VTKCGRSRGTEINEGSARTGERDKFPRMAGDNRIIAFDASGSDSGIAAEARAPEQLEAQAPFAIEEPAEEEDLPPRRGDTVVMTVAAAAVIAWSAFFIWSQYQLDVSVPQIPGLIAQWAVPVLLGAVGWLLWMRNSRREAVRFADVSASLARASGRLETRLATVNRELSLAREFVAAQSRDLEALGRLAVDRLSQNADRLQDLIRDNGARLDTIDSVSRTALDNMDKLRGQLPVVANSAKDVANQIGGAGRVAQTQLDELLDGLERLTEAGKTGDRQVAAVRRSVSEATGEFARISDTLERHTTARFAALAEQGAGFRSKLEADEAAALAAVRERAATLAQELGATRAALDEEEAESLRSLRARLTALRDEGGVVGRALRDSEARAADAWSARLEAVEEQRAALELRVIEAERAVLNASAERLRRLDAELGELQLRLARGEQDALAYVSEQLAILDGAITQRLVEHDGHTRDLAERAQALTALLEGHGDRMALVARHAAAVEADLGSSLGALTEHLSGARATLVTTDGDVNRLTEASVRLLELIQASARQTTGVLPEAITLAEDRLARASDHLARMLTDLQTAERGGEAINASLASGGDAILAFLADLAAAQATVSTRNQAHEGELVRLLQMLGEVEAAADRLETRTRHELLSAIERLTTAIHESLAAFETEGPARVQVLAERLGTASAEAVEKAMRPRVAEASGALEQAVAHASGAGREAAAQLREQIAAVEELAGRLEERVAQARRTAQEQIDNDFSRRVALITDTLNSNAIDIASALSADVSDTAWAAYLRGDRGIFTRRAVSLLGSGEARAVQQLFERDEAFRGHVSRYVHDFEAILRQILSTKDGNALGVTLLSSDMGKLYVALAQAIERLRS